MVRADIARATKITKEIYSKEYEKYIEDLAQKEKRLDDLERRERIRMEELKPALKKIEDWLLYVRKILKGLEEDD